MMSVTTIHKFLSIAVASGALLVGASLGTAHAEITLDNKNYPGTMCRPASYPSSNHSTHVSYERNGSIANQSEQASLTVLCPIIRDMTNGRNGLSSVAASFGGPHEPTSFRCSLYVRRGLNNRIEESTTKRGIRNWFGTTVVSFTGPKWVNFSTLYMLNCVLPKKRKGYPPPMLHSYTVRERTED